jgi:hypothetical protein
VDLLSVEENALRGGRFTSINMRYDTNISSFFDWKVSRHMYSYQR